jgi:3-deoxy-D-manno-octulosonate 8-phosphate phosphatase (KDO 8-P phosphatase)
MLRSVYRQQDASHANVASSQRRRRLGLGVGQDFGLGAAGEELKVFHVRDGSGLVAIQRAGVTVAIISGRDSAAVMRRAGELGIRHVRQGVADKGAELDRLLAELGVPAEETACVGDDTPDAPMLRRAGLAIGVADAHPALLAAAHWVTKSNGGHGAVREVCDLLLSARSS